jgi:hypothetical protein
MVSKIRPQILAAIITLAAIACYGIHHGLNELATGSLAGITALGMKVLERSDD